MKDRDAFLEVDAPNPERRASLFFLLIVALQIMNKA
jgi:hypothetical protein